MNHANMTLHDACLLYQLGIPVVLHDGVPDSYQSGRAAAWELYL